MRDNPLKVLSKRIQELSFEMAKIAVWITHAQKDETGKCPPNYNDITIAKMKQACEEQLFSDNGTSDLINTLDYWRANQRITLLELSMYKQRINAIRLDIQSFEYTYEIHTAQPQINKLKNAITRLNDNEIKTEKPPITIQSSAIPFAACPQELAQQVANIILAHTKGKTIKRYANIYAATSQCPVSRNAVEQDMRKYKVYGYSNLNPVVFTHGLTTEEVIEYALGEGIIGNTENDKTYETPFDRIEDTVLNNE